jgi:predicted Zn-dependent peptidase
MSIQLTTLPSGLRVITDTVTSVDSVALGVWADVGTRDEDRAHNGVAHMVEHLMFKGTKRRNAIKIAEEVEDVGGQMNAWTSREMTAYHIHLLRQDMPLALDILSDLLLNSTLPEEEIQRERQVILQEIGMTNDTPDDLVFDHYQEAAYPGQAIGDPILGRADVVAKVPRDVIAGYIRRFYTPPRLVVSAAGNVSHEDFVTRVEKLFAGLPTGSDPVHVPARYAGGEKRAEKALEQSHIVLGFQGISRHDNDYYAAVALSILFGGGMSSRLFQEVREKRGLAYSVFSFHSAYQDDGQFAIYAGTGPDSIKELIPVLCDEIRKISGTVAAPELARAKAQMRAGLLMGRESMMTRAGQQAKQLINFGTVLSVEEKLAQLESVTVKGVQDMACRIFCTKPTLAALGPLKGLEDYAAVARRLAA